MDSGPSDVYVRDVYESMKLSNCKVLQFTCVFSLAVWESGSVEVWQCRNAKVEQCELNCEVGRVKIYGV